MGRMDGESHTVREPARTALVAAAVALAAGLLYLPATGYQLSGLDDADYLLGNPLLPNGVTWNALTEAFKKPMQAMYAPVLWISYMLDIDIWHATRAHPWGFHLTNILLHSLNAGLFFVLLRKWTGKTWAAAICAGLWAFHPLRVESVAWVAERKDVLSGAFFLGTLWAYGEAFGRGRGKWGRIALWGLSLASAGLGMLTKASLTPLPGVLLLMDFWPLKRCGWTWGEIRKKGGRLVLEKMPFAVLAAWCSRMALVAHESFYALGGRSWAPEVPVHYGFYLEKILLPLHLHPLYPVMERSITATLAWGSFLVVSTWFFWRARQKVPEALTGWLWFLGVMLPASGVVDFGAQSVADRFTYLPAMGLSLALLPALGRGLESPGWKGRMMAWGTAGLLAGYAIGSIIQERHWRDVDALMARMGYFMPRHPLVLLHRGMDWLRDRGDYAGARRLFEEVLQMDPLNTGSCRYHSVCLCETVSPMAAATELGRKRELETTLAGYDWLMGVYCYLGGHYREVLEWTERRRPQIAEMTGGEDPESELAMAAAFRMGDGEKALACARGFRRWRNLEKVELADLFPLYAMLWADFLRQEGAAYFLELEAAYPDRVDLLNNMAWLVASSKWSPLGPEVPLRMAERACALGGENAVLLDTLGVAQANAGNFEAAVQTAGRAVQLAETEEMPKEMKKGMNRRLEGYRRGEAYREDAGMRLL